MKRKKLKSISYLKRKADKIFSDYIRHRDTHCYTCRKFLEYNQRQNGHYISRKYLALRYDPVNCHTQDVSCNIFLKGNLTLYALHLIEDYGQNVLKDLDRDKLSPIGDTRSFLM